MKKFLKKIGKEYKDALIVLLMGIIISLTVVAFSVGYKKGQIELLNRIGYYTISEDAWTIRSCTIKFK